VYVQCTVQSETVISLSTLHSTESDCYWCMYSAQCRVRLLLVCTVHSAESDCYWCVYSAQCSVRLLLLCVQCTVQSETVIGVCTVHSAE